MTTSALAVVGNLLFGEHRRKNVEIQDPVSTRSKRLVGPIIPRSWSCLVWSVVKTKRNLHK